MKTKLIPLGYALLLLFATGASAEYLSVTSANPRVVISNPVDWTGKFVIDGANRTFGNVASGIPVLDSGAKLVLSIMPPGVVQTTRTLTAGNGLTGGGDLSSNRTISLGTPSALSVSSTNNTSGTTHTHAITSSSNPGSTANILATDASGFLRLVRLGLGIAPTQPLHVAGNAFLEAATANLFMKDTSTGFQVSTTQVINPLAGNALRRQSFTSGVEGWNIPDDGRVEFMDGLFRGELRASVFTVNELSASAGTLGVFLSASTLTSDCLTASTPGAPMLFIAENSTGGAMLFAINDVVRMKAVTPSGVSDAWATITARTNNGSNTTYTATFQSGSASTVFPAGIAIADYGPSGSGFITLSADGTVGSSPNLNMATHAGSPWSAQTNLLRLGNLNGSYGYATNVYGLGIGQYGTASQAWQTIDQTHGLRIGNNTTVLGQWDTAGNATFGHVATNKANAYWNNSNQRLEFRGSTNGTTVQSYIDTDGAFTAGGGNVKLGSTGLSLNTGNTSDIWNEVRWKSGADSIGLVANYTAGGNPVVIQRMISLLPSSGSSTWLADSGISAVNDTGQSAIISVRKLGTAHASGASLGYVTMFGGGFVGLRVGVIVGIPTAMLDVDGNAKIAGSTNANLVIEPSAASSTTFKLNTFNDNAANRNWAFRNRYNANGTIELMRGTTSTDDPTTAVLSFNNASAARFHALGAGTMTTDASGNVTVTSDERLKDIEGNYTRGLDDLEGIQPKIGKWKTETGLDRTQSYVWAVTAQNALETIPEAVSLNADDSYTVSSEVVIATLVNSVKQLRAKVAALEGQPVPEVKKDGREQKRDTELKAALKKREDAKPKEPLRSATPEPTVEVKSQAAPAAKPKATPRKK